MKRILLAIACSFLAAGQSAEEKAVIAVVQQTFDGMAANSSEMLRAAFHTQGEVYAVMPDGKVRAMTLDAMATRIGANTSPLLERMWSPRVMITGRIALLTAPYDLWRDGKFSHCGVDNIMLLQTESGWKINNITYTVQTEGCAPSPLGPPATEPAKP
jgi:hypothetical protein